jgi:hypothetical protein
VKGGIEMKVENMKNKRGNRVRNQFLIHAPGWVAFQSYGTIIAKKYFDGTPTELHLDKRS